MKRTAEKSTTFDGKTGLCETVYERQVTEMAQILSIGQQNFETVRKGGIFYVDKTDFIREWWGYMDPVTLITRPRRFGKTLMMSGDLLGTKEKEYYQSVSVDMPGSDLDTKHLCTIHGLLSNICRQKI